MSLALQLFIEFFKTGLFAVGGGLATLPFLYEMSARTGWYTAHDIADMIAISEATPGPVGINMATYVGYITLGVFGGLISTIGLVCPSVIIIIIISKVLDKFRDSVIVSRMFYALRPASTALIASAGLGVAKISLLNTEAYAQTASILSLFNWKCILLCAGILAGIKIFNKHPIVYIGIAAVIGIVFKL